MLDAVLSQAQDGMQARLDEAVGEGVNVMTFLPDGSYEGHYFLTKRLLVQGVRVVGQELVYVVTAIPVAGNSKADPLLDVDYMEDIPIGFRLKGHEFTTGQFMVWECRTNLNDYNKKLLKEVDTAKD